MEIETNDKIVTKYVYQKSPVPNELLKHYEYQCKAQQNVDLIECLETYACMLCLSNRDKDLIGFKENPIKCNCLN